VRRRALPLALAALSAAAQAPVLQDGAEALRRARLDWVAGDAPLGPSSLPSLEVGWGGAESGGAYAPLLGGEGLGHGTRGWGLGLQGHYASGGWTFDATALALRDRGTTVGVLQRAGLAYQGDSGWRAALEQAPFAWGPGPVGGELLGDAARSFSRLSLATPEATVSGSRWRTEAFAGWLERDRPIPDWMPDRAARLDAQAAGRDLHHPLLWGGLLRAGFGPHLEVGLGAATLEGGQNAQGQPAPASAARTQTLADLRVRFPALARLLRARGAAVVLSREAAPDTRTLALAPARERMGLQLVWEGWDLGLEIAGAAPREAFDAAQPAYLAGFSSRGDALGPAFGRTTATRTVDLGLPLFLEGRGRLRLARATAALDDPSGPGAWFAQLEAQWRTPTGRLGAALASRRDEFPAAEARWGWACSVFQAFRVF